MTAFVVDASVAAKWCFPEEGSAAAAKLLADDVVLYAPDLIYAEVGNVAWKHVQRGECSLGQAQNALALLRNVHLVITPVASLQETTLEIAAQYGRSFYDAAYLALAIQLDAKLVTADKKFVNAMSQTPLVKVISVLL